MHAQKHWYMHITACSSSGAFPPRSHHSCITLKVRTWHEQRGFHLSSEKLVAVISSLRSFLSVLGGISALRKCTWLFSALHFLQRLIHLWLTGSNVCLSSSICLLIFMIFSKLKKEKEITQVLHVFKSNSEYPPTTNLPSSPLHTQPVLLFPFSSPRPRHWLAFLVLCQQLVSSGPAARYKHQHTGKRFCVVLCNMYFHFIAWKGGSL